LFLFVIDVAILTHIHSTKLTNTVRLYINLAFYCMDILKSSYFMNAMDA
jgi:hypothetical protein